MRGMGRGVRGLGRRRRGFARRRSTFLWIRLRADGGGAGQMAGMRRPFWGGCFCVLLLRWNGEYEINSVKYARLLFAHL